MEIYRSALRNEQMWPNWKSVNHYPDEDYDDYVEDMIDDFVLHIDWLNEQISNY